MTALTPILAVVNGIPTTTSNEVAQHFGKQHKHVLDKIAALLADLPSEFAEPNFRLSEFTDSTGRALPAYRLTRDGFTLLAMGFTGKKALAFKLAYIDAFNRMEAELLNRQQPPAPVNRVQAMSEAAKLYGQCMDALCPRYSVPHATVLACAQVKEATGIDLASIWQLAPPKSVTPQLERLVNYVSSAPAYAGDNQFSGADLATRRMPHGKLLKLMKMKAADMAALVDQAVAASRIAVVLDAGGVFYTVKGA